MQKERHAARLPHLPLAGVSPRAMTPKALRLQPLTPDRRVLKRMEKHTSKNAAHVTTGMRGPSRLSGTDSLCADKSVIDLRPKADHTQYLLPESNRQ